MARNHPIPTTSFGIAALLIAADGIIALISIAVAAVVGIAALEVLHAARARRFSRHMETLERNIARNAQSVGAVYRITAESADTVSRLVDLECRRIRVQGRINGGDTTTRTGPNSRLN